MDTQEIINASNNENGRFNQIWKILAQYEKNLLSLVYNRATQFSPVIMLARPTGDTKRDTFMNRFRREGPKVHIEKGITESIAMTFTMRSNTTEANP
jgi:hypothetical protein